MLKRGALLLLLAVVVSQVDLSASQSVIGSGEVNISSCPINFYGRMYSLAHVSFRNSSAVICFKNNITHTARDCLLVENRFDADRINVSRGANELTPGSILHRSLSSIKSNASCFSRFDVATHDKSYFQIMIYNLGSRGEGAAQVFVPSISSYSAANITITAKVGTSSMGSWTISASKANGSAFIYLSGCRHSAAPFVTHSNFRSLNSATCTRTVCTSSGNLVPLSTCKLNDVCLGKNRCIRRHVVCTVTGSTVIDFFNREHSVSDRCVYNLMKPQQNSNFQLLAGFRERRRQDVPFLDHLILWLSKPGVKIYLEQGGRVRVDEQILTLNSTAQLHYGVKLSKDQTGVSAKLPFSDATVFFDGYTAHVSGPIKAVEGLCGTSDNTRKTTTLKAEKSLSNSTASCRIQHKDTTNTTANCSSANIHCDLMRKAPFTACHKHISPKPFINACTNTLCTYPAVDGLKCQFLEAYAKACIMKTRYYNISITLEGWRSKTGCSAVHQAFCQDRYCSAHEFCGEKKFGGKRCFCRAIFASKYKSSNALGEPTVCSQNSATLTLAGCLLEDKGIDYSVLHLKDQNCKGHMDNQTHMVTFSFNSNNTCGTEVMMNNSQIIYKNTIMLRNSSLYGIITRHDQVEIDFSCFHNQPDMKSVSFKIKDSSVVQTIISGFWNYTLMMNAYTDPGHVNLVRPTTEIRLNQKIWVELKTEGLDDKLVAIVTDSCWATNQPSPNASLRYDLIKNKCPNSADQTVKVEGNGLGTSNTFSFNMFQFSGKTGEVYLHCKLELCPKQGKSCVPRCGGGGGRNRRSPRSEYADKNSALITMAWSN